MAKIHQIVKWPEPVLTKRGEDVTVFDEKLKTLVEEMFESMYAAQGIGLATWSAIAAFHASCQPQA